jgi:heme exporter protein D
VNINLSQFSPYIWLVVAILVVIVVFVIVRFFWQHVLKYLLRGCLVIVGILILLEVLHYLKVF